VGNVDGQAHGRRAYRHCATVQASRRKLALNRANLRSTEMSAETGDEDEGPLAGWRRGRLRPRRRLGPESGFGAASGRDGRGSRASRRAVSDCKLCRLGRWTDQQFGARSRQQGGSGRSQARACVEVRRGRATRS
jgi:hypothetical protein